MSQNPRQSSFFGIRAKYRSRNRVYLLHRCYYIQDLSFSRRAGVTPSWWCHIHFQGAKIKLRSRAFFWCIVCFCTSNGSLRILKKAGRKFSKKKKIPRFHKNDEIKKKKKPLAFSNFLKEPLLIQKQTIHQQKALDFRFSLTP